MFNSLDAPKFKVEDAYDEFLSRVVNAEVNKEDKKELLNFIKSLQKNGEIKEELNISTNKLWGYIKKYCSTTLDKLPTEKTCPICGLYVEKSNNVPYLKNNMDWSIEHIKPKSSYLEYICEPTNLVRICTDCNINKGDWAENVSIIFNPYIHEYPNLLENVQVEYHDQDKYRFHYEFKLVTEDNDPMEDNYYYNYEKIYKVGSSFKEYTENFISAHFISPLEEISDFIDSQEELIEFLKSDIVEKLNKIDTDTVEGIILTEILKVILNNISSFITVRKEFDIFS